MCCSVSHTDPRLAHTLSDEKESTQFLPVFLRYRAAESRKQQLFGRWEHAAHQLFKRLKVAGEAASIEWRTSPIVPPPLEDCDIKRFEPALLLIPAAEGHCRRGSQGLP